MDGDYHVSERITPMDVVVVLFRAGKVKPMLRWAGRFAHKIGAESLRAICCRLDEHEAREPRELTESDWMLGDDLLREAGQTLQELEGIQTTLVEVSNPAPERAMLEQVNKINPELLVIQADGLLSADAPLSWTGAHIFRGARCHTILLDPGASEGRICRRTVVPMGRSSSRYMLRLAERVTTEQGVVVPLLIGSGLGSDAEDVTQRELKMHMADAGVTEGDERFIPRVLLAESRVEGLLQASRECNLLMLGGTGRDLREYRTAEHALSGDGESRAVAIAVASPAKRRGGLASRTYMAMRAWLPELTLADRLALFERVQGEARWTVDFATMIGLSTAIACLGLLNNSTPVVIGAMLVAPLMTPLIGAGLALAQGNVRLFRRALTAMGGGVMVGFVLSLAISWAFPKGDLPLEASLRGAPNLIDLFVALFSGMAAAYAFSRASVAEAIAGVAVATALVPPLASIGVALTFGNLAVAQGAAILLLTNMAAIILGASIVFRLVGAQGTRVRGKRITWVRSVMLLLIVLLTFLFEPLGFELTEQINTGQVRPMAYPLSRTVSTAIRDRVDKEPGVNIILMGRSGTRSDLNAAILLVADRPVSVMFLAEIENIVYEILGKEATVRVTVVRRADLTGTLPKPTPPPPTAQPAAQPTSPKPAPAPPPSRRVSLPPI